MKTINEIMDMTLELGASNSGIIDVSDIVFDAKLRDSCVANHCGKYNKNWTCPPHVGEINQLIDKAKQYSTVVVYQLIGNISDSFDWEGMQAIAKNHENLTREIFSYCKDNCGEFMLLGAGGCKYCSECCLLNDKACEFPDEAIASLEAYGIFVTNLAECSGMNYINGKNTVTYFGAILLKD